MKRLLLLVVMVAISTPAYGQDIIQSDVQGHNWDVFIQRDAENSAATDIIFVDLLTGATSKVNTSGEGHALTSAGVIYVAAEDRQVKLAKADGIIRDHPYITASPDDYQIDWVLSGDRKRIAWATARKTEDYQLVTSVHVADSAGTDIRAVLQYGPRPGVRLLPIAFASDEQEVLMEVRADGTGAQTPYARSTGLFALNFAAEEVVTRAMPGDQSCFCAVGFGTDIMLRLTPNAETMGIDVQIYRLDDGTSQVIPAVSRGEYDEAGNMLVSPDDMLAVYALSQVSGFGTPEQEIHTVLVLVDLQNLRQTVLNSAMRSLIQPISWTEDKSALLFTTEDLNASWKLNLATGQAIKVADAVYLGKLTDG